jgi:hypothetical protein
MAAPPSYNTGLAQQLVDSPVSEFGPDGLGHRAVDTPAVQQLPVVAALRRQAARVVVPSTRT